MKQKILRFLLLLGMFIVITGAGLYTWRYLYNPCEVADVQSSSAFLDIQLKQYDEVYMSAANGTRSSLTYPVTVMQKVLLDTTAFDVPACMQKAQDELTGYMNFVITAFKAYEAGESDATVNQLLTISNAHYDRFRFEVQRMGRCAPFCLR